MTANTDKLLSILTGILITVLVYFLVFPGSRQVYFGAYVWHRHLLHIEPVIQYRILHPANATLHIRLDLPDRRHLLLASYQQQQTLRSTRHEKIYRTNAY